MNMKKMKKFFTLSRRAEGFTLVELIVVIAILAILGGVAVPAYGGYVKKANMQADMTLISEIEHALELAGYSGTFNEETAGYVVLSANGPVKGITEGSALEKALVATFGSSYADTLKLKHAEWGNSGLLSEDSGIVWAVDNSSYMNGSRTDRLLVDVEKMTTMAKDFTSAWGGNGMSFADLFGADKLNATAAKYGIGEEGWDTSDWETWGAENSTEFSNLLVLTAADEFESGEETSMASGLISDFSSFYGLAATDPEFSKVLDEHMARLESDPIENSDEGAAWFKSLQEAAESSEGYSDYHNKANENGVTQSEIDKAAFQGILAALGNPNDEQAANIANDLKNANLFSAGTVNGMYNDYMNTIDTIMAMAANGAFDGDVFGELNDGEVMILFVLKNGILRISNSLPSA